MPTFCCRSASYCSEFLRYNTARRNGCWADPALKNDGTYGTTMLSAQPKLSIFSSRQDWLGMLCIVSSAAFLEVKLSNLLEYLVPRRKSIFLTSL